MAARQVVTAFTDEQVARLTEISVRQLRYWDETEFFNPEFAWDERKDVFSRIYSYLDLVSLKVIARLRKKVPLQRLRVVKEELAKHSPDVWRGLTLWVDGADVAFFHPESGAPEQVVTGQKILKLPLADTLDDLDANVKSLFERDRESIGRLAQKRRVMHNRRVIAGTRIPVSAIRAFHDAGYSVDDIIAEYPTLQVEDITTALEDDEAA